MKNIISWLGDLLRLLTQRLFAIFEVVGVNFYSIVLLIVLYFFYWEFDQAQDLLLTLNQEKHWQVTLFFFTLGNLAVICWYIPKYLYPENNHRFYDINSSKDFINAKMTNHYPDRTLESTKEDDTNKQEYNIMVPRLLGTAVLLIVALAILNVVNEVDPAEFGVSASKLFMLFSLIFLVLLLVSRDNETLLTGAINRINKILDKQVFWLYLFFIFIGAALFFLALSNKGAFRDISSLVAGSLLISLAFLIFTIFRSYIIFFKVNRNVVLLLLIFSGSFSLVFLIINISTAVSQKLNPLICANLAFILYLSVFYWLRVLGKRKRIYLVTLFLLAATILFFTTSSKQFYQVKYVSNQMEQSDQLRYPIENRVTMSAYFDRWINHRRAAISAFVDQHGYFPIFVLASEGGGSRAGYWTSIVYGHIQKKVPQFYDDHLFAFSGASGGMTGSSTFFSMKEGGVKDKDIHGDARKMFQQNFLSGTLTRLLGFDIWQETMGLNLLDNRAVVLQEEWATQLKHAAGVNTMSQPYLSFWYEEGTHQLKSTVPPLLLVNTTFVQRGNHAVFSPVIFDSTYYRGFDFLAAVDRIEGEKKTVQLNTATVLNASFPYICPAGFVDHTGNFVDAGYYDNLGAQTAIGVLQQLKAIRKEKRQNGVDSLYSKLRFVGVQVRNDLGLDDNNSGEVINYQLNAPLVAFSKTSFGFVQYDLWNFKETPDAFYQVNLTQESIYDGRDSIRPIIPLARYLSKLAIKAMDASLKVQEQNVNSDLNKIIREMK